ncbi:MAG: hypothetical protein AB1498_06375 [bacterium]
MKKREFLKAVLIYIFVFLRLYHAQESNYIKGTVETIEGEYVYIGFDNIQGIEKGMLFGIYDQKKTPVAICEITKFRIKNSFVAFILMQVEDVREGYSVFSNTAEEAKLREKIKKEKSEYYDFYKEFNAYRTRGNTKQESVEEFLLYQILSEAIFFLNLDINWFKRYDLKSREKPVLNPEEKDVLDIYRDIIFEGSKFENVYDYVSVKSKINLGKLKYRLTQQGYSLKPKIIRLIFSSDISSDDIKTAREVILENSMYVSSEEENPQDVTSPISFVIYTTPEIFAEEIDILKPETEDIYFIIYNVEGDTIEMDVSIK